MKELAEVRTLKEGRYVVLDEEPCTITSMTTSKPGKHGAAKARIEGIGVFDGQKRTAIHPVTAKIYVPVIERKSGQVLSVSGEGEGEGEGDTAQIMDHSTNYGLGGLLYGGDKNTRGVAGEGEGKS